MRSDSPRNLSARPPATEAPRVLAMVLRLRMAELVSSIFLTNFSMRAPFLGYWAFSCSISEAEVLRSMASRREQRAERLRVNNIVRMSGSMLLVFEVRTQARYLCGRIKLNA